MTASFIDLTRSAIFWLPATLRYIDDDAFYGCKELQSIEIPASVERIGDFVFTQCWKPADFACEADNSHFSASGGCLYNKDKTVLWYAPGVERLSIPNTVKTIGTYAFYYNPNLTSVTLPESVVSLEEGAFGHCDHLKEAVFEGNGLNELDDFAFAECFSLETVRVPESLTTISKYAFYKCSGFTIYAPKGSSILIQIKVAMANWHL